MPEMLKSFLSGQWIEGKGTPLPLYNPTTEDVIAQTCTGSLDFKSALAYARTQGGSALRALTFQERAQLLTKMADSIHAKRDEWIEVALQNSGNTRKDAKFDIDGATAVLSAYAEFGTQLGARHFLAEEEVYQLGRNPRFAGQHILTPLKGVAVHINAFNFPAWGFAEKAAVALLAGMPVLTKPATSTALLTYRIFQEVVPLLPSGVLSLVCGSVGDLLDHLTSQDVLAFTGSSETGSKLKAHSGLLKQNVRINIEADSLNSTVLGSDVEPDSETYALFLHEVLREMTAKAGQKCTAIRRIFVPAHHLENIQEQLVERLKELVIGDPQRKEVQIGPLATKDQVLAAKEGLQQLQKNATLVYGQLDSFSPVGVPAGKGYFFPPVLLKADPANAPEVHSIEVFGPVATLLPYAEDQKEQLYSWIRQGDGSLVCSVFSNDKKFVQEIILEVASYHGRILVGNDKVAELSTGHGTVLPQLMHGGPGRAGGGEEMGGLQGLHFYLQRTAVQGYRPLLESLFGAKKDI